MAKTEREIKQEFDKANSYRLMMDSWAWKDFESILESISKDSVTEFEQCDQNTSLFKLGELKGQIKAITAIEKELEYILNPLK